MSPKKNAVALVLMTLGFAVVVQAEVTFSVSISDAQGEGVGYYDELETALLAAANAWGSHFDGDASIEIRLSFDRVANVLMYAGAYTSVYQYSSGGLMVYDWCTAEEIRSGFDVNGSSPDATVTVNPDFFDSFYFDPNPGSSTARIPYSQYDAYSVFLHELGHAFVFNGWLEADGSGAGSPAFDEVGNPIPPGQPQRVYIVDDQKRLRCARGTVGAFGQLVPMANYVSVYDEHVEDGSSGSVVFAGDRSEAVSPGGIPLDPESYCHTNDPDSVMHTYAFPGRREQLTSVELAVAEDCGVPVTSVAADGGGDSSDTSECDSDSDSDGVNDCDDECPSDPDKTELGDCGCDDCPATPGDDSDTDAVTDDDDPVDDEVLSDTPDVPTPACGGAPVMLPFMAFTLLVGGWSTNRRRSG